MKKTGQCPKCGSKKIVKDAKVIDHNDIALAGDELTLATFRDPDATFFKGKKTSTVSAWVCASCGFVELYADFPTIIYEAQQ